MKRRHLLLLLLFVVLASQIPFAYRRYRLGRLNAAIQALASTRRVVNHSDQFSEYRGVVHVHSSLGGHSSGTYSEIISAAQQNQLQFVIMTEHPARDFDTAELTLKGVHAGVLFLNGNEVRSSNNDRFLIVPGDALLADAERHTSNELVAGAKGRSSVVIVAYPDESTNWKTGTQDGVEVYNVYTNARRINPLVAFFDGLWSHHRYPDLIFANYYTRPVDSLKAWDEALAHERLTATAGNDSHANIGISLNDASGKTLWGLKLDPYEVSFHLVRVHVLIPKGKSLDSSNLMQALRQGHCFIGFDLLGDTSGFSFTAQSSTETVIQGDEIRLGNGTRLTVEIPIAGRVLLLKDGKVFLDENEVTSKDFSVNEPGVYRVEVYLPSLGKPAGEQPWIVSNPIYVR